MKNKYTPLTPMQIAGDSFLLITAFIFSMAKVLVGDGDNMDTILAYVVFVLLCINIISVKVNHKLDWLIEQQEKNNEIS